jgi:predicted lipoprotein with Yx(FWY)xxD motif
MRPPRRLIAIAIFAVTLGTAGIGAAVAAGGSTTPAAKAATTTPMANGATTTIHTLNATVNGKSEAILVNSKGLPLYFYKPDTATKSSVSGALAALWPPLDSTSPTVAGATGKLSVTHDSNGAQVAYNGHFLYSFAADAAEHVSGQGVDNFFVATPGLAQIGTASSSATRPASATTCGSGYGY